MLVSATSQLSFAKYLGYAFSNEVAKAQISLDAGQTWQTVWSQPGNDGVETVDSAFMTETVPLSAYAGHILRVRFVYAYSNGFFYNNGSGLGVYFDNITVIDAQQASGTSVINLSSSQSFSFVPTATNDYLLAVRAKINTRVLPWGPGVQVDVAASTAPATLQLVGPPLISGSQVQLNFTVANFRSGMTFQLLRAPDLNGGWTPDGAASLQTLVPNSQFRFTTSLGAGTVAFFRIKSN